MIKPFADPLAFERLPWEGVLAPDWRRIRAVKLLSQPRCPKGETSPGRYASRRLYDPLTLRYIGFLKKLQSYTTDRGVRILVEQHPDLFLAEKIAQEPSRRPWEIQARALAGQSDRAIARAVGLPGPTVAAYLGLFFDVRERRQANVWIRQAVLGLSPEGTPAVETLGLFHCWKRGPGMVEPWLDYLSHQGDHHDLRTEGGRQRAALALFVAVQQLPDDVETQRSLVQKSAYFEKSLPEISQTGSLAGVIAQNSLQMLDQLPWKEPEREVQGPAPKPPRVSKRPREREKAKMEKAG